MPRAPLLAAAAVLLVGCAGSGGSAADGPGIAALLASAAPGGSAAPPARFRPSGGFGAYLAGRHAATETETAMAADQLLRAERLLPQDGEVVRRAFLAAVLDARPEALRLARRLPDNPIALMLVAGAEAQAGRWDRAEAQIRAIPPREGLALLQPLLLAWAQAGRGQTDAALATLRPLTEGGRARALGALHAAMIADLAGRGPDALRFARASLAESPEPNLRQIQVVGAILLRRGAEAEAVRLAERLPRGPEDLGLLAQGGPAAAARRVFAAPPVASAAEGMADAKLAFAGALRADGAGEFALALSRLALRLRPAFAPALILAAEVLSDEQQHAAALALLARMAEDDPFRPVATLRRAVLLDRMDRTAEAEAMLRALADSLPEAAQPWARLGDVLRGRSRFGDALAAYDAAVERLPPSRAQDWTLLYARGVSAERAGQWPRAEADFRRALELSPDQPFVLNYLAYSWVEQGRNLVEARAMLERAVALRPQDGHIVDSLGWALYRLGELPRAVELLERAVELEPRNATINDHLGDAYWASGRRAEAMFQWRRALGLDPDAGERARIEAKLGGAAPTAPGVAGR
jgi:tetratricopeptide (TPR) repeat protein